MDENKGYSAGTSATESQKSQVARGQRPDSHREHDRHRAGEHERRAKDRLRETGQHLRHEVEQVTDAGKHAIAEEVRSLGSAAKAAADELRDSDHGRIGAYARGLTRGCEDIADYLDEADPRELGNDAASFARSNPAVFLGLAALAGFALGRLATARPPRHDEGFERHEGRDRPELDRPVPRATPVGANRPGMSGSRPGTPSNTPGTPGSLAGSPSTRPETPGATPGIGRTEETL